MAVENNSLKESALKAAGWKLAERFGASAVSILVQIVLARLLSPVDFGLIALVVAFTGFATIVVQGGLNTALVQADEVTDRDCSTVFWASMAVALVCYVLLFLASDALEVLMDAPGLSVILKALGLILLFAAYNSVQVALLQRRLLMRAQCVGVLAGALVSGAIGVALAVAGFGVWALVAQTLLQQVVSCVVMAFQVPWKPGLEFDTERFRALFGFGWKLLAASSLHSLYTSLYDFIVGACFSIADLGYFSQGKKYPYYAESILDSVIMQVTLPAASKLKRSADGVRRLMRRGMQMSAAVIVPFLVLLAVAAEPVVLLVLGDQWGPSVPYFQIFCIAATVTPLTRVILQCINAVGRSDIYLKTEIIRKASAIALVVAAAFFNDLMLLAYCSIGYALIAWTVDIVPAKVLFGYGPLQQVKDIAAPVAASVVAAGLCWAAALPFDGLLVQLAVQVLVFCIAYILISYATRSEPFLYSLDACKQLLQKTKRNGTR